MPPLAEAGLTRSGRWLTLLSAMKDAIKKRDLVRRPSLLSKLKPGQSLRLTDAPEIEITRRRPKRLTADELDRELRPLVAKDGPAVDSAALWEELRG